MQLMLDMVRVAPPKPQLGEPSGPDILDAVAASCGLPVRLLTSEARDRDVVEARRVFYDVAKRRGLSTTRMGAIVRREHSTVVRNMQRTKQDQKFALKRADVIYRLQYLFPNTTLKPF